MLNRYFFRLGMVLPNPAPDVDMGIPNPTPFVPQQVQIGDSMEPKKKKSFLAVPFFLNRNVAYR